jgi:hypothetical protein
MTVPIANPTDLHWRVFVCRHVFAREKPVLLVSRPDGDWCFLCGGQHAQSTADFMSVGVGHVLEQDDSLIELLDLKPGWEAERKDRNSPWILSEFFEAKE